MDEGVPVNCESCELYDIPVYCIGGQYFDTPRFQMKRAYLCACLKGDKRDEVDSLTGMRTRNKTDDLDDKIKNLKTELTSLVGEGSKLQTGNNNSDSNAKYGRCSYEVPVIKQVHKSYEGCISYSGGQVHVNVQHGVEKQKKADNQSDQNQFSQWLDSTIDSIMENDNSNDDGDRYSPPPNNVIPDSSNDETDSKDNFEVPKTVKELLYESFVVKSYPYYIPNTEVKGVTVQPINLSKRKHEKTEESKGSTAKKTKTSEIRQNNRNVMTLIINDSSDSEVEVINIDDDSNGPSPVIKQVDDKKKKPIVVEIINKKTKVEKKETQKRNSCSRRGVWECPICFEQNTGQEVVTTMCGHVFCKKCLDEYYDTYTRSCPTCRTDLHDKPVITLFNF